MSNRMINTMTFGGNQNILAGVKPLLSPSVTPIKPLPFSPSQFLNSPSLSFDNATLSASTPVRNYNRKVIKKNTKKTFQNYLLSLLTKKKKIKNSFLTK